MSETVVEPGLRERKRQATRRAIMLAALQLVGERGLEGTTVDEISRAADVSPRTFFNYFASKEEALVGEGPRLPDDEAVDRFVAARGPLLHDIGDLFDLAADDALQDKELLAARRDLNHRYPHLSAMRMEHFRHFETELEGIVARRLAAQEPALDEAARASRARLAVLVALAAMRHAWMCFAASPQPDESIVDRMRASFAELDDLLPALLHRG